MTKILYDFVNLPHFWNFIDKVCRLSIAPLGQTALIYFSVLSGLEYSDRNGTYLVNFCHTHYSTHSEFSFLYFIHLDTLI